jgi:hypothetical protein
MGPRTGDVVEVVVNRPPGIAVTEKPSICCNSWSFLNNSIPKLVPVGVSTLGIAEGGDALADFDKPNRLLISIRRTPIQED